MHRNALPAGHILTHFLLVVAIAVFGPAIARATTYYVGPGGSDANTGTSSATRWATIAKANARVAAGDVVMISNGSYTDLPRPAATASSSQRITYVGNLANPAAVTIAGWSGGFDRDYVTVKGFQFVNDLSISGDGDSVAYCVLNGSRPQIKAANDVVLANSVINSQRFWCFGSETDTTTKAKRNTIVGCTFNLNPLGGGGHTIRLRNLEQNVFRRCRFNIVTAPAAFDASPTKMFLVKWCQFIDCSWDITTGCVTGCDEAGDFVLRDVTQNNSFVRDTILFRGPGPAQLEASASGTYVGTVMNNNWDSCVIKQLAPGAFGAAMVYQNSVRSDTMRNCVIVGRASAWKANQVSGETLIENCTMVGWDPWRGVIGLDDGLWPGRLILRSNIFYTHTGARHSKEAAPMYGNLATVDGHLLSNYNLVYSGMSKDSSIYCNNVGFSAPGVGKPWCVKVKADSMSRWGLPKFTNASSVLAFDAHLESGSSAIGAGWGGRDAGAYPFSGVDATPPATVTDLVTDAVYDSALGLAWTAPGDDGQSGQASAYDLRWSTSAITAANFGSATPVSGLAAPDPAGSREAFLLLGLRPNTTYYLAIKTRDSSNNWSAMSNVRSVRTNASDITPPATITDLSTSTP